MKNSFWLGLQYLIAIIASLVTLKLNLWHFGASDFGYWLTLSAFWGAAFVIDAGVSTSSVVFIAEARRKNDYAAIDRICSTALFFFIGGSALLYGIVWCLMHMIVRSSLFDSFPPSLSIVSLSSLIGLAAAFAFILSGLRCFFEGFEEFPTACRIGIAFNVVLLLIVVATTLYDLSLIAFAAANVICTCAAALTAYFVFRWKFSRIRLSPRNISPATARSLFTFGIQVQLATFFGSLIDPVIKFSLGKHLAIEQVSSYEIARRFALAFSGLFSTAFRNLLPKSSGYSLDRDFRFFLQSDMIRQVVSFGNMYTGFFFGICTIATWGLIHFWFRCDDSLRYFLLLALPEAINIMFYPFYVSLIGDRKTRILVLLQFINICLIASTVYVGTGLFKTNLALFSYVLSVAVADVVLYYYYKKTYSFDILNRMGLNCLLRFCCMQFLLVGGIAATFLASGLLVACTVSVAAAVLFFPDYLRIARTRKLVAL